MDALGRSDRSSGSLKGRRSVVSRGKYPRDVIEIVMTGLLSVNSNLPFSSVFVPAPVPAIFTVAPGSGPPSSDERTVQVTVSWAKVGRTMPKSMHIAIAATARRYVIFLHLSQVWVNVSHSIADD